MMYYLDKQTLSTYTPRAVFEPYRRDAVSKALFQITSLLAASSLVTVWFSPTMPGRIKLVIGAGIVIVFFVAWVICPTRPPGKEVGNG